MTAYELQDRRKDLNARNVGKKINIQEIETSGLSSFLFKITNQN